MDFQQSLPSQDKTISKIYTNLDKTLSSQRNTLWKWYSELLSKGYAELAFRVSLKLIPGNMSYYWDNVIKWYFTTIGPANPELIFTLESLKRSEITNSLGLVSIVLIQSPRTQCIETCKVICSKWAVPPATDPQTPEEWRDKLMINLEKNELLLCLYYIHLLFNTKRTIKSKYTSAKVYIWQCLMLHTQNHWFVCKMCNLAMLQTFLWKPITFYMILQCLLQITTSALNTLKEETANISIDEHVRKWVENVEKCNINQLVRVYNIQQDTFWKTVEEELSKHLK